MRYIPKKVDEVWKILDAKTGEYIKNHDGTDWTNIYESNAYETARKGEELLFNPRPQWGHTDPAITEERDRTTRLVDQAESPLAAQYPLHIRLQAIKVCIRNTHLYFWEVLETEHNLWKKENQA